METKVSMEWIDKVRNDEDPNKRFFGIENDVLALLLINEVVATNNFWYEKEWPKEAQEAFNIFVNCNDVFMWGSADGERLPYNKIEEVYEHWVKDENWGAQVWCIKQRNMMPQKPVYDRIMAAGIWNLDEMGLEKNPTW